MNGLVLTWLIIGVPFGILILGVMWKIFNYPTKEVHYINEWGNPRVKIVDDPEYHYKDKELWEPPPYWTNWQKNEPVVHNIAINDHGDDDWPHTENHV